MALLKTKQLYSIFKCRQYSVLSKADNKLLNVPKYAINNILERFLFWERDRKGGYNPKLKQGFIKNVKDGFKELKSEIKLLTEEIKDYSKTDPLSVARPEISESSVGRDFSFEPPEPPEIWPPDILNGTEIESETDVIWCFNGPKVLDSFITTCDSDHNEGYSSCGFDMSPAGRALFHGYLDTRVPKDGRIKKAGYCAIRSKRVRKSFKRESTYNWHLYNTLVLKVRGDGRSYLLNLSCEGYYDITWNDIYHYVLYTRGGPYWQIAKIPFSKFILGSKGRVQDKQNRIRLDRITHFGISCGDKINGVFNLEIEYVGLEFDPTHNEDFAYEMYKTDKYIVGV